MTISPRYFCYDRKYSRFSGCICTPIWFSRTETSSSNVIYTTTVSSTKKNGQFSIPEQITPIFWNSWKVARVECKLCRFYCWKFSKILVFFIEKVRPRWFESSSRTNEVKTWQSGTSITLFSLLVKSLCLQLFEKNSWKILWKNFMLRNLHWIFFILWNFSKECVPLRENLKNHLKQASSCMLKHLGAPLDFFLNIRGT